MAIGGEMGLEFGPAVPFVSKRAFNCKNKIAAANMLIDELRAFDRESWDNDRSGPAFPAFVRQIDDQSQLVAGNLRDAFPATGGAFCRLAKRGASQQNRGD